MSFGVLVFAVAGGIALVLAILFVGVQAWEVWVLKRPPSNSWRDVFKGVGMAAFGWLSLATMIVGFSFVVNRCGISTL
jgi:hypothetical protein